MDDQVDTVHKKLKIGSMGQPKEVKQRRFDNKGIVKSLFKMVEGAFKENLALKNEIKYLKEIVEMQRVKVEEARKDVDEVEARIDTFEQFSEVISAYPREVTAACDCCPTSIKSVFDFKRKYENSPTNVLALKSLLGLWKCSKYDLSYFNCLVRRFEGLSHTEKINLDGLSNERCVIGFILSGRYCDWKQPTVPNSQPEVKDNNPALPHV